MSRGPSFKLLSMKLSMLNVHIHMLLPYYGNFLSRVINTLMILIYLKAHVNKSYPQENYILLQCVVKISSIDRQVIFY